MKTFALFAVLASFSLNLVLQTGLGIDLIYKDLYLPLLKRFLRWASLFISVFLFWLFWTYVLSPLTLGFFDIAFIFPLCAFVYFLIDKWILCAGNWFSKLFLRIDNSQKTGANVLRNDEDGAVLSSVPLCIFSLFITLRLASNIEEAAVLSFFFSAGCFFSVLALKAIHIKCHLERSDKKNLGVPLAYISTGLLAFVFYAVSTALIGGR